MNVRDRLAHYGLSHDDVLDLAGAIAAERYHREQRDTIHSPHASARLFEPFLAGRSEEVFAVAFLDARHQLIKLEVLFRGTVDGAAVYPRTVAERALRYGAAAVLIAHNHPSGNTKPSRSDKVITDRLRDALGLLEIQLLDHLIVGVGPVWSFESDGPVGGGDPAPKRRATKKATGRRRKAKG